jgi:3-deoxy-D-manno-octulosonic-acid transferase
MMASMHRPDVPVAAMVARHGDAELIGATMDSLGVELVRGAGAGGRKKDRGGASALRGALQCLAAGKSFVMTADVPPGPARRCGEGIVTLARLSGRPIVPLAVATSRYLALDTWSRLTINLPYSKLAFVYGEAIHVPRDADPEALEQVRLEVERSLNAATARAYALAGADPARATPRSADASLPPPKPGLALKTYRVVTRALHPLASLVLDARARRGKEDPARRPERLGQASRPRPSGPLAWIHAASVGEINAVLPLIDRIGALRADLSFLVTTGTMTSAGIAAARLGPRAIHQFVPVDSPQAASRFLDHWRPDLAVFTESEIWPNLILATADRDIPLALVNGRMSARSQRRWRRRKGLSKPLFGRFAVVLAQNDQLARQFALLGAPRVETSGNLKIDSPPPPVDAAELRRLAETFEARPLLVAASTHEGEEDLIAEAHRRLRQRLPGLATIIAPRHPERGTAIAESLKARGLTVAQRSAGARPSEATDIYLADTIGELGLFYALGKVVFLGGSLVPHGGQNPIEAIRHECVVMSGPSTHNFTDIYGALRKAGAVADVVTAEDMAETALRLLTDEARRRSIRKSAHGVLGAMGGALAKSVAALLPLLPPAAPRTVTPPPDDLARPEPEQGLRRAVS